MSCARTKALIIELKSAPRHLLNTTTYMQISVYVIYYLDLWVKFTVFDPRTILLLLLPLRLYNTCRTIMSYVTKSLSTDIIFLIISPAGYIRNDVFINHCKKLNNIISGNQREVNAPLFHVSITYSIFTNQTRFWWIFSWWTSIVLWQRLYSAEKLSCFGCLFL